MIDNAPTMKRLARETDKSARCFGCNVELAGPFIKLSHKNRKIPAVEFDVRIIDGMKDPLGRQLMSVKVAGQEERFRVYATADGSILFGIMHAWG